MTRPVTDPRPSIEVAPEWVHLAYAETAGFQETYGFAAGKGMVNLEGIRFLPRGVAARTLLIYMHPATTLQLLPMPQAVAARGVHVLCAASRYARNDTALTYEAVLRDVGAWVRHARDHWGYDKVVLGGWSGGGSLMLYYQAQAERPTVTHTPAGDPADMAAAGLIPADALTFQAAHVSRAELLRDCIDPSVRDEANPEDRDPALDLYGPAAPPAPYPADWLAAYRAAQQARMDRITARVRETLERLKHGATGEVERAFVTHRTLADPRFLDLSIDPNDRPLNRSWIGEPRVANSAPAGLARVSTLRAWLSQWSMADSLAHGETCARSVTVPILSIENTADEAVPQPHTGRIHAAAASADKTFHRIEGASHYYAGQPEKLAQAVDLVTGWMQERGF